MLLVGNTSHRNIFYTWRFYFFALLPTNYINRLSKKYIFFVCATKKLIVYCFPGFKSFLCSKMTFSREIISFFLFFLVKEQNSAACVLGTLFLLKLRQVKRNCWSALWFLHFSLGWWVWNFCNAGSRWFSFYTLTRANKTKEMRMFIIVLKN